MLKGLAYVLLPSSDLVRSVGFYKDVLGLPLVWLEREQGHAAVQADDLLLVLRSTANHLFQLLSFHIQCFLYLIV